MEKPISGKALRIGAARACSAQYTQEGIVQGNYLGVRQGRARSSWVDTCLIQNLVCDPCWAICRVDGLFPPEGPRKDQERGAEAKTVSVMKLTLVPSTQMKSSGRLQFPTPQTSLS